MSTLKITQNKIKPAIVASIEEGSIGEELGFEVGDRLISINGVKPRDLIDYKFLILLGWFVIIKLILKNHLSFNISKFSTKST